MSLPAQALVIAGSALLVNASPHVNAQQLITQKGVFGLAGLL